MKQGIIPMGIATILFILGAGPAAGQWTQNGGAIVWTSDDVGIGTANPETDLHVVGGMKLVSSFDQDLHLLIGHNVNGFFFISPFDFGTGTWEDLSLNSGGTTEMGQVEINQCLRFNNAGTGDVDIDFCNDDSTYNNDGVTLRTLTNPPGGEPIFRVLSSGGSERLRVEHNGRLYTTNRLFVAGTGDSYFAGRVGIGDTTPDVELSVNGVIKAQEVRVTAEGWPDFVFSDDYHLMPLEEIESSIRSQGHLPEMPSAQEVATEGVGVGEMQAKLLRKIEELTLHMIALQKQNNTLQARLETLEAVR